MKVIGEQLPQRGSKVVAVINKDPGAVNLTLPEILAYFSMYMGLVINLFFACVKITMGIAYSSSWLISVGVYYAMLGGMRFMLLIRERRSYSWESELDQRKYQVWSYFFCGLMMLLLNIILTLFGVPMIYSNPDFAYPKLFMDAFVVYAVYSFIVAVVNLVRYYKISNPMLSAANMVSLVTALVAVFSLQSAILAMFADLIPSLAVQIINSITGSFIAYLVFMIALNMIGRSAWELHRIAKKSK